MLNNLRPDNETLKFYRYTNENEKVWTYKVKESQGRTVKFDN